MTFRIKVNILLLALCTILSVQASEPLYDYIFFDNSIMTGNYYYSTVSYSAPSWLKNSREKLVVNQECFFSPGNSLEISYKSVEGGDWSAEVQYRPVRGNDLFKEPQNLSLKLMAIRTFVQEE